MLLMVSIRVIKYRDHNQKQHGGKRLFAHHIPPAKEVRTGTLGRNLEVITEAGTVEGRCLASSLSRIALLS